jgi:hypothetical protein
MLRGFHSVSDGSAVDRMRCAACPGDVASIDLVGVAPSQLTAAQFA